MKKTDLYFANWSFCYLKISLIFSFISPKLFLIKLNFCNLSTNYYVFKNTQKYYLYKDDEFYLFGDSAGGGLAVTLLQILRNNNYNMRPTKSFLASPWVDISMTNKDIKNFEKKDPFLDVEAVKYAAKQYVGNLDLKDPLVSPLYGEMNDLGSIYILVGTHEILNPDIYLLNEKMKKAEGTNVKLYLGNKMFHDWIVMGSFKESKDALSKAGNFYLSY